MNELIRKAIERLKEKISEVERMDDSYWNVSLGTSHLKAYADQVVNDAKTVASHFILKYTGKDKMRVTIQHRTGGVTIVNDLSVLDDIIRAEKKFIAECVAFHYKMMELGVKAYRCNDGWVNREHNIVTFHPDDRTPGYYWGNRQLKRGDKIFLIDTDNGGKFAYIDYMIEITSYSVRYHYILSDEIMDAQGNVLNLALQSSKKSPKRFKLFRNIVKRIFKRTKN